MYLSVCEKTRHLAPARAARGSFSTRCRVILLRQNCLICKAPFLKVYFQKFKSFLRVSKVCQPLPRKIPQGLSDSANLARPRHIPTVSNSFDRHLMPPRLRFDFFARSVLIVIDLPQGQTSACRSLLRTLCPLLGL